MARDEVQQRTKLNMHASGCTGKSVPGYKHWLGSEIPKWRCPECDRTVFGDIAIEVSRGRHVVPSIIGKNKDAIYEYSCKNSMHLLEQR